MEQHQIKAQLGAVAPRFTYNNRMALQNHMGALVA